MRRPRRRQPTAGMAGYPPAPNSSQGGTAPWATPSRSWAALTPAQKAAWPPFRAAFLRDFPWCAIGFADICTRTATTVDHLDGCNYTVDFLNREWCRPACRACHRRRTSQQGNAAQLHRPGELERRVAYAPKPKPHGW